MIEKTFKQIPSTRRDRQELIYKSCTRNEGIIFTTNGNIKIREELARDAINSIDKVTQELTNYLWRNIEQIIGWANKKLFKLPEIRSEIIGVDENIEKSLLRKAFDTLIQRLARPATDIFLSYPRVKQIRAKVLREYQIELMILDSFIINGTRVSRGIIPFIASGKFGKFHFELSYEERLVINNSNNDLTKKAVRDKKSHTSGSFEELPPKDAIESKENTKKVTSNEKNATLKNKTEEEDQASSKKKRSKGFFGNKAGQNDIQSTKQCSEDNISINSEFQNNTKDYEPFELDQFQNLEDNKEIDKFNKLNFSEESDDLKKIQIEIEEDINEFICCMKNSVFYGSGIIRFYNQELDKYRRKFIELEENKHRWLFLVSNKK